MADYYPLIARAIAGLDPSAPGESRRALYERARTALIAQLRSVEPPLSESEITRERLSLEEAVRKVESEAAQRARDATRPARRSRGCAVRGPAARAHGRPAAACRGALAQRSPAARAGRGARPAQSARRSVRAAVAAAADPDGGCVAAADPRTAWRRPSRPRQQSAAGAGHARVSRYRGRRRRSRARRGAGQPRGAENLCQCAVALAGIRPARAE